MNTCKDCKWWDTEVLNHGDDYDIGKRSCLNPKIFITGGSLPNGYPAYGTDPDGINQTKREKESLAAACDCSGLASFITSPEFGCNLFEKK
jgi:hypothetical protein